MAPPPPRHPRKRAAGPGTVAIIVDYMGSSIGEVNELMAIRLPLTFSIIPGLAKVKGVAQAAHAGGYQVMIHIPMEPQGYPQQRMEQSGLLLAQSDKMNRFHACSLRHSSRPELGSDDQVGG